MQGPVLGTANGRAAVTVGGAAKLVAVIVTFNKLALLQRCLAAVKAQIRKPDAIVVVDNASTDGTREWLKSQTGIVLVALPKNTGGSGGFHAGMKEAHALAADWIWLMDDDCIPTETALEVLADAARKRPHASFLSSLVLWRDGTPCRMNTPPLVWDWTDHILDDEPVYPIAASSFVSCLVNAAFVGIVGYPVREFFIWYDDFEYTQRLSAAGPAFLIPRSVVHHETAENVGVDWSKVNDKNAWKYGYGLRNELSLASHRGRIGAIHAVLRGYDIFRTMSRAGVGRRLRLRLLARAVEGFAWDYRQCIERPARSHLHLLQLQHAQVSVERPSEQSPPPISQSGGALRVRPPPEGKEPATVTFALPEVSSSGTFLARLAAQRGAAAPLEFCIDILRNGAHVRTEKVRVAPGENGRDLAIPLLERGGGLQLRLSVLSPEPGQQVDGVSEGLWFAPRVRVVGQGENQGEPKPAKELRTPAKERAGMPRNRRRVTNA